MVRKNSLIVLGSFLVALMLLPFARSQEAAAPKTGESATGGVRAEDESLRRRLPNYYGRLGLTDEQREKIYGVQAKYREQIQNLEKQLRELRRRQDEECEAVLTEEQRMKYRQMRQAARKKRASRPLKAKAEETRTQPTGAPAEK